MLRQPRMRLEGTLLAGKTCSLTIFDVNLLTTKLSPCPGLNAAANHGYLPRSGIATIEQTVSGLGALYNMDAPLAAALSAYAVATDGNPVEGVWSIGGPLPADDLTSGLLGTGQGLSYSHNAYEGDASIGSSLLLHYFMYVHQLTEPRS